MKLRILILSLIICPQLSWGQVLQQLREVVLMAVPELELALEMEVWQL